MTKEAPTLTINLDDSGGTARDVSNDITSCDISTPRNVQDITGVDKSAIERLLLLADYSATFNGVFNDASNLSFDVGKTVPSSSVTRTTSVAASGQTLAVEAVFTDYALTRGTDGSLTWTIPALLQSGTAPTWA